LIAPETSHNQSLFACPYVSLLLPAFGFGAMRGPPTAWALLHFSPVPHFKMPSKLRAPAESSDAQ